MNRLICGLCLLSLFSCQEWRSSRARARVPRVILISIDTLHVNRVGPYNPDFENTPFLDRFAKEGIRFEHAYTPTPITLPSHATLMTGVSPPSLGVMANGDRVPDEATTLAEILASAGYQTSAFISLGVLQESYGLGQGFQDFHDPFVEGPVRWYRRANEIFEPIRDWLGENKNEPFFLWVHFSDPHEPYVTINSPPDAELWFADRLIGQFEIASAEHRTVKVDVPPGTHRLEWRSLRQPRQDDRPETGIDLTMLVLEDKAEVSYENIPELPKALREMAAVEISNSQQVPVTITIDFAGRLNRPPPSVVLPNYDANVAYTDRYLEKLNSELATLGLLEDTLTVIVSDHGEGLFAHNSLGHASHVYEDQLRILWMMRGANLVPGQVLQNRPALMRDVAPTILDILGLPSEEMEGRSWYSCLEGNECPSIQPWWSYGLNHASRGLTSMASYHWPYKWIWRRSFRRIAFNVAEDPFEEINLLSNPGPHNPKPLKRSAEAFRAERRRLSLVLRRGPGNKLRKRDVDRLLESLGYLDSSTN